MSGLAGIVYPDQYQMNDLIKPMVATLEHRYSEGADTCQYQNIQIAGSCGKTAYSGNRSIFCAFDGTLSNDKEIAQALRLKSAPAADLILKSYEVFGSQFLEKIEGDFAIVILDQNKKKLILARDRIGRQPLYWFQNQHHFIFASELKAILSTGAVPQTPAIDALSSYLFFGYIPQDMGPIEGINKLLPAHYLQYHFDGRITIASYWSYSSYFESPTRGTKKQILNNLDKIFESSVQQSLSKDHENIGCFISGGLGSASVAYYLNKQHRDLTSYTVGFEGENQGDLDAARLIAESLDIPQEVYKITEETFTTDLVKINWHLDEPIADPNIVATWKLCELACTQTGTVFSGMGSDELFAGHSRYTAREQGSHPFKKRIQTWWHQLQRAMIPFAQVLYKPLAYELIKESRTNLSQFEYLKANSYFNEGELAKASPRLHEIFDPEVFLHKFHHLSKIRSTVASYLYFDVKTRLVDCYIHQFERLTAAHKIQWQSPFLNRRMIEYLASLPEPDFMEEEQAAKYLKLLMKHALPEKIVQRPKRTRQFFLQQWMEADHMRKLFARLPQGTLVDNGLISQSWLNQQLKQLGHSPDAYRNLWPILQLEIWFRLFINRPITSQPPQISVLDLLEDPS